MPYKFTTEQEISEEQIVKQDVVVANIYDHKVIRFTIDLDIDELMIVDTARESDERVVETSNYHLILSEQPEAFADIEQSDVGVSLYDVVAGRLYEVLVRNNLLSSDGSVVP